jgi:hypothetical protein
LLVGQTGYLVWMEAPRFLSKQFAHLGYQFG